MTPNALLREFESLSHDARMRRMVEIGRRSVRDATLLATLAALARGDFAERLLALQSCWGSGDADHALRALADPSRLLRRRAVPLLARFADDEQARQALDATRGKLRRALLAAHRRRGRLAPIDAFLDTLAARGDDALAALLPFGSTVVERHAGNAQGNALYWDRLARRHPALASAQLTRLLQQSGPTDARLVWQAKRMLPLLARCPVDVSLPLAAALARLVPLGQVPLQALAQQRPNEVADILLDSEDAVVVRLDRVAHRLDADRLLRLLRRRPETLPDRAAWFRRLPPARRSRKKRTQLK
jgi:hypothetical protein